uniref:Uncharacterized protein n=1 Tax=Rhizophora mucronata TaxID=61149 RepID=A0A2P2N7F2_RHIMU
MLHMNFEKKLLKKVQFTSSLATSYYQDKENTFNTPKEQATV